MCGACGAASAGSASMHWSTPFLGSVPARTAAARNLTAWARSAGSNPSVTGVAGGFQVATASGRRQLAGDLGKVVDQLADLGFGRSRLLAGAAAGAVIEGPATPPPARTTAHPASSPGPTDRPAEGVRVLPPDARRRYRVPALLAWLSLTDGTGELGEIVLELDLGHGHGVELEVHNGDVRSCRVRRTTGPDRVWATAGASSARLLTLLG